MLKIVRYFDVIDEQLDFGGGGALRKISVGAIVKNPYAGKFVDDLSSLIAASIPLGEDLSARATKLLGEDEVQSYGKGGIVGLHGEQEHVNALLTTAFAKPFRNAIGGGKAWISSFTKRDVPGASLSVPLNHKDNVYVRSHYDGVTLIIQDAPQPDEILVAFCLANRGRINARVGGLTHEENLKTMG